MDYEQMEIDITLESDRDLKENMQATAKFALGQIMEYQHPTKVKNRHEGYGIAAEGYASLQGKMKSTKYTNGAAGHSDARTHRKFI